MEIARAIQAGKRAAAATREADDSPNNDWLLDGPSSTNTDAHQDDGAAGATKATGGARQGKHAAKVNPARENRTMPKRPGRLRAVTADDSVAPPWKKLRAQSK